MIIKYLELKNHPILGNLKLELFDNKDKVYNTVVFAGENGVGKTALLNVISSLFDNSTEDNYVSGVEFYLNDDERKKISEDWKENKLCLEKNYRINNENKHVYIIKGEKSMNNLYIKGNYLTNNNNPIQAFLNDVMIKTRKNGSSPSISIVHSVSDMNIDESTNGRNNRVIDLDASVNVSQLLVDVNNKDAVEFQNYYRAKGRADCTLLNKRLDRFKKSFNSFFDNKLTFYEVNEKHAVLFKKHRKIFDATRLSLGEKTIVQCGASLLKNYNSSETSFILIDEPEQALHPRWQEKILKYYRNIIFGSKNSESQLFITTHSEHVLKEALEDKNNIVVLVLEKNRNGNLKCNKITKDICALPYISYDEIKYKIFNLPSSDYHDDLLSFIQEETKKNCVDQDKEFRNDNNCEKVHWNGYDRSGNKRTDWDCETLPLFVRNYYHHPELRKYNKHFKINEEIIKSSINYLESIVKEIRQNETV